MQVKVVALAAGAAVLLVALQAFSQTGDEAAAKSLADLRVRAEQGDAEAKVELGHMYANGDGVPEDDAEAVRWFRLAAEQGHVEAQFVLGILYAAGNGVPKDDAEALRWVRRAAEQGSARATYGLGVMYAIGAAGRVWGEVAAGPPGPQVGDDDVEFALWLKSAIGENVQQDDAEAVRWFRLGIEQGDAGSQFALGLMYAAGEGVPQDAAEAERLMRRAAEQGDGMAQFLLWDELEGAEALRWVRRAAEQDHAWAQFYLGLMYDAGAIKNMPVFFRFEHSFQVPLYARFWDDLADARVGLKMRIGQKPAGFRGVAESTAACAGPALGWGLLGGSLFRRKMLRRCLRRDDHAAR